MSTRRPMGPEPLPTNPSFLAGCHAKTAAHHFALRYPPQYIVAVASGSHVLISPATAPPSSSAASCTIVYAAPSAGTPAPMSLAPATPTDPPAWQEPVTISGVPAIRTH